MVDKERIKTILEKYYEVNMNQVTIHDNGVVDVIGDVTLKRQTQSFRIQFGKVGGNFTCSYNQLYSLVGAPTEVGGNFACYHNRLTSLEYGPQVVRANYYCYHNQLTSLAGAPKEVGGDFSCAYNQLTSLSGAPREVGGDFYCRNNQLTSLAGAPDSIGSYIILDYAPTLPLLRCLVAREVHIARAPEGLSEIIKDPRWIGKGKKGSLMCAAALIRAGFEGNARW